MKATDIRSVIERNMVQAGMRCETIRIQQDPFVGWRIAVVSAAFAGLSSRERRDRVLSGLEKETFQWVDLLTPEEAHFMGDLTTNVELEDLPLWAEALARMRSSKPVTFASDLDEDLNPPIIVTFYSCRGGVGRSTALAYAAHLLARRGHSVLCLDMDLEAPGLACLFGHESEVRPGKGLLSVLLDLDQGETPDLLDQVIRVSQVDELYCLPAGVPDADYARRLRLLDPEAWYREDANPLRGLLERIGDLPFRPGIVLIDARTGLSPISAPLLFDLSDVAIVSFFPHPQSLTSTGALVRALLRSRSRRTCADGRRLTPEPRFLVCPIPPRELERYRRRAEDWAVEWLKELGDSRLPEIEETIHVIPYAESIASSDSLLIDDTVLTLYEPVADWVQRFVPLRSELNIPRSLQDAKPRILESLSFSVGAAETQEHFRETFVKTDLFEKAMSVDRPLVVGRKGTGKTALFRWFLENRQDSSVVVMGPASFRDRYRGILNADGFAVIDQELRKNSIGWREFWTLYTAVACGRVLARDGIGSAGLPDPLRDAVVNLLQEGSDSERGYVLKLAEILRIPSVGLLSGDWLQAIDDQLKHEYFMLFDGLDTGFGSSPEERERRRLSLEGLFTVILDRESLLDRLKFKVLIRADIWNVLRFENKSHLTVRAVRLAWRDKADYAKTVLKQALRDPGFKELALSSISDASSRSLDSWLEQKVYDVWHVLVGERMKGGKSTYTLTWVWNRLADANADHSPRALFHLFREAADWERRESRANPYDRSIIRSRALVNSLQAVSEEALQSLLEEFEELVPLADRLVSLGRSPLEAELLQDPNAVAIARETGLLGVHEEAEGKVHRYRVPDLYRLGLGMTRKGQA